MRDMKSDSRTEGGICEVSFGYHYDLYGCTTRMSDMMELYDISCHFKKIYIVYDNINVLNEIKTIQTCLHKGRYLNVRRNYSTVEEA